MGVVTYLCVSFFTQTFKSEYISKKTIFYSFTTTFLVLALSLRNLQQTIAKQIYLK